MKTNQTDRPWHQRIEIPVVLSTLAVVLAFFSWAFTDTDGMGEVMNRAFKVATHQFGWLYLLVGFLLVIFAFWLAYGRYGEIKLGGPEDKPEYSYFSWFAMIFACGYGVGLVYWGAAEPLSIFKAPPFGVETGTPEAGVLSLAYAFFHWGWTPWAIYMAIGVPMAYFMHCKGASPRFSAAFRPLMGERADGWAGKMLDSFLVIGVIGGVTTATGLGIMQLASGLNSLFGIPETKMVYILIAVVWISIFTFSTVSGIDKGIKVLSNINIPLAMILMLFVFFAGPTIFQINMGMDAFGLYLTHFFKMSFWTDSVSNGGFPQGWTIFYWAWWIASAPATGLFVANISRGRTIREMVLVHMFVAPIATWLWFTAFGGTALYQELIAKTGLVESMTETGTGGVVFTMLEQLPMGSIMAAAFLILVVIFLSTTVDSYSYVCAQVSTRSDANPELPPKGIRALWAIVIGLLGITLVMVGKGISGLQLSSIVASLLIIFIMVGMCVSMVVSMRRDDPRIPAAEESRPAPEAQEKNPVNA
ncbi:BCCT family transporter [Desulfoluna spongiiphila]|uniref:BCCT family transporter n=1 Tax=Desulfoluna spongiiphila TaxID=419481 RepID=UPI0012564967|nr:BCCT family transporter [Desulfoluna spongiiphila]VVS93792.1 consensus disorder prediction [Desulfoluna spongiiphila]